MKHKIISAALALMLMSGALVGCSTVEKGVEEVMPSASAPAATGTATAKPSMPADDGMDANGTNAPSASPSASASPAAETGIMG